MASEREIEAAVRGEWIKSLDLAKREDFPVTIYTRHHTWTGRVNSVSNAVVELCIDRRWISISLLVVQAVELDIPVR